MLKMTVFVRLRLSATVNAMRLFLDAILKVSKGSRNIRKSAKVVTMSREGGLGTPCH